MSNIKNNSFFAVIMAGGVGSRFWPVSTPDNPKQFQDMMGIGKSLLQQTYNRLLPIISAENILISTNEAYKNLVIQQLTGIAEEQLILEPTMRNTAPAILFAALKIYKKNPDALMIIAPSDHWIDKEDVFLDKIKISFDACSKEDILMTLGIIPTYPNTGYGYIQYSENKEQIKKVNGFTEKPDYENALKYIESGDYLWNAGIFIWSAKSILQAFEKNLPKTYHLFLKGNSFFNTKTENAFINESYPLAENISVDYAILEKANNVFVLPAEMDWNDLGTWGALHQKLSKDAEKNASVNAVSYFVEASGNIIHTQTKKKVVIKGLRIL